jgi:GNAT superfamily N-acetyltransferase
MNLVGEIKWYLGNDYAQLKFSETKGSFSIDIVTVPQSYRGLGIGSAMIQRIILLADSVGKDVHTSARPIGSTSEEKLQRLVEFYQQFDFCVYDRGLTVAHMKRTTQKTTTVLLPEIVLDRKHDKIF